MTHLIRAIAVSAAVAVLALTPAKTSARGCGDDQERKGCQASPVQLDQFMKTWKPVSASKSGKRTRTAWRSYKSRTHSTVAAQRKSASESKIASESTATTETKVASALPTPTPLPMTFAAAAPPPAETDGVAVTSYNEVNEVDQAAPPVKVVAFNEVNEIDMAAPPPPVSAETVSQAPANNPEPADNSWIGKLLLAAAGTIALAGGARMLVA